MDVNAPDGSVSFEFLLGERCPISQRKYRALQGYTQPFSSMVVGIEIGIRMYL